MAGEDWDHLTIVPSSKERPTPHPLEDVIGRVSALRQMYVPAMVKGPGEIDHNTARDDGYVVNVDVQRQRFLLIDDMFTSGARLQSAASALQIAGARVPRSPVIRARPVKQAGRCTLPPMEAPTWPS
jgi:hypothetical protein